MPLYRDVRISDVDKSSAHQVVTIFAEYFDTLREGLIDPAWQHDWPTREEILENYFVNSSSYAKAMGANFAVDVMGGPVRVFHDRTRGERGSGEGFPIVVPLMVYTRRAAPANSQTIPALQEQKWQSGLRKLTTQAVSIALPTNRGDAVLDRFYLPVDVVIPRCLRMLPEKGKRDHGRKIFPQAKKYKSKFKFERKGKEFEVTLTQLAVELSVDDPFSKFKVEGTDDRGSGGALTPGTTCILVEVHEPSNPIPILTAFLRVRIKLVTLSFTHIVGERWEPQISASETEPVQYVGIVQLAPHFGP